MGGRSRRVRDARASFLATVTGFRASGAVFRALRAALVLAQLRPAASRPAPPPRGRAPCGSSRSRALGLSPAWPRICPRSFSFSSAEFAHPTGSFGCLLGIREATAAALIMTPWRGPRALASPPPERHACATGHGTTSRSSSPQPPRSPFSPCSFGRDSPTHTQSGCGSQPAS